MVGGVAEEDSMAERERRGSTLVKACAAVALLLVASPGRAAEVWLHPVLPAVPARSAPTPVRRGARPARPAPPASQWPFPTFPSGESSPVELTSGERYPEAGSPIAAERIDRSLVRLGEGRPMPLTAARPEGAVTRLEATWAGQGLATLAVLLVPEARTVEAVDFEAFLAEAGAAAAAAERAKRKESKKAAKVVESFSARAFAGVAPPPRTAAPVDPSAGTDAPLGLPLEIVAGVPPLPVRAGSTFPATVLLDGRPAAGATVRAYGVDGSAPAKLTADENGAVSLPLAREGRLLLAAASVRRTTKADRAKGEAWKRADWEIRRATLELVVLPAVPAPAPAPSPKAKRPAPKTAPR